MNNQAKNTEALVTNLLEYWERIPDLKPALACAYLRDMIDASIKDIEAGNLQADSHIVYYIEWINENIQRESNLNG
jgi:hypothetical protein